MNIKYILGIILTTPLWPLIYFHGKKIKARIPDLPEAKEPEGLSKGTSGRSLRILAIGESSVAGVGVFRHEDGFTGILASELASSLDVDIAWKVYAKSGYTVKEVNHKIAHNLEKQPVDLIIIGIGANDSFQLNSLKHWKTEVRALIKKVRAKFEEVPIVFVNMPPIKDFPAFTSLIKFVIGNLVEIFGEELGKIVKEFEKVYYSPRTVGSSDMIKRFNLNINPEDFFSDGVHPSKIAYQVWAKVFSNYLLETPEINSSILRSRSSQLP
jgi:lysophospholipase L1-like esterase